MNIPLIDLKKEYEMYGKNIEKAVIEVMQSGSYILGNKVMQFENEIANYLGVQLCCRCSKWYGCTASSSRSTGYR